MTPRGDGLQLSGLGCSVPCQGAESGARRWLLRGFDLELERGAQLVLLGPSGSGKSTLLSLIAGLASPDEGSVWLGGDEVSRWSLARREAWRREQVGLVFQQFQLFGQLSALDNVLLPWTFDHFRIPAEARRKAGALLDRLGVAASQRCGLLSRGEQQRVAIARALSRRPSLVLADEPTASLDPAHAVAACSLLQQACREQGAALIVATHDLAIAGRFERAISLAGGKGQA